MQSASIRITLPLLGSIDIHVSFRNGEANVTFLAQHGVVKEAIEAAIPRLQEMFIENNLQLANVDVGQRESGTSVHYSNLIAIQLMARSLPIPRTGILMGSERMRISWVPSVIKQARD